MDEYDRPRRRRDGVRQPRLGAAGILLRGNRERLDSRIETFCAALDTAGAEYTRAEEAARRLATYLG